MKERTDCAGTTLLEMMLACVILVVLGTLVNVVLTNSASAVSVAEATEVAQSALRDTLREIVREVQVASKHENAALVPPVSALRVVSPGEIVFQVPVNDFGTEWSAPITYRFVNEDAGEHEGAFNGILDPGEDKDEDGSLTRRLLRIQNGEVRPIAPANDLSNIVFSLNPAGDALTVTLAASKASTSRRRDQVHVTASTDIYLQN